MTSRTRGQALAMIEAMRSHLGGVALEIGALCRIGTADAALLRRTLAPAADPAGLLAWAGWQQVHEHAQILVRPAPEAPHPWLLADDIPTAAALAFAARRAALVIETSPGNCQLRVLADRPLSLLDRTTAQRALRAHLAGDPGSIAGDKWGRLAGFKNQKPGRDGCCAYSSRNRPPLMIQTGRPKCSESGRPKCSQTGHPLRSETGHLKRREQHRQNDAGSPTTMLPGRAACTATHATRDRAALARPPTSMISRRPTPTGRNRPILLKNSVLTNGCPNSRSRRP